jgi:endonuclease/exonuclease/phosphatase family metal-dependent hydrolase
MIEWIPGTSMRPGLRRAGLILLLALAADLRAEPVKVVAWNLEWFPGRTPDASLSVAQEHIRDVQLALRHLKPDILIVSEIKEAGALRTAIKDLNGLRLDAISQFPGRPQQVAICSRFPVRDSGWGQWGQAVVGPPRGFAYAELELASNVVLQVQAMHWKSNRGVAAINEALRTASALQCEVLASALLPPPGVRSGVLLAGDLNTSLDDAKLGADPSLRYLIGRGWHWPFGDLTPDQRKTWQGWSNKPSVQFDHFLTRGLGSPQARVGSQGHVSDHQPILMTLQTEDVGSLKSP